MESGAPRSARPRSLTAATNRDVNWSTLDAVRAHQPLHGATGDVDAVTAELVPDPASSVGAVAGLVDPADVGEKLLVAHGPRRGRAGLAGVVRAGRELQHPADRLEPEAPCDPSRSLRPGTVELLGEHTLAALRISLARRSSATSRRSLTNSSSHWWSHGRCARRGQLQPAAPSCATPQDGYRDHEPRARSADRTRPPPAPHAHATRRVLLRSSHRTLDLPPAKTIIRLQGLHQFRGG